MIAGFRLIADSVDVTDRINRHVNSISMTDKTGLEADDLTITLNDPEGNLPFPKKGTKLELFLGMGDPVPMGSFIVTEPALSGPPDIISITARGADLQGEFLVQREQDWHRLTLGAILDTIATRQGLKLAVHDSLARIEIDHIDQTNESDANFLSRLGQDHDAIASVKNSTLLFIPDGLSVSASGTNLPPLVIDRSETSRYSYTNTDRENDLTGVKAKWRDKKNNRTRYSTAGTGDKWKTLKKEFPNAVTAHRAAKAEWARMSRGKHELSLSLPRGNPAIHAGLFLSLQGWRSEITSVNWITKEVVHDLTDQGYLTSLSGLDAT